MMPSVSLEKEATKYLRVEEQTAGMIATTGPQAQGLRLATVLITPAEDPVKEALRKVTTAREKPRAPLDQDELLIFRLRPRKEAEGKKKAQSPQLFKTLMDSFGRIAEAVQR